MKKKENAHDEFYVNLLTLENFDNVRLDTIKTSGDPLTGNPWIEESDFEHSKVTIRFENVDWRIQKSLIKY